MIHLTQNFPISWKLDDHHLLEIYNKVFFNYAQKKKYDAIYIKDGAPNEQLKADFKSMGEKTNEEIISLIRNSGIACFSEDNSKILMWSHYANCHKGIWLEFIPNIADLGKIFRVLYSSIPPIFNPFIISKNPRKFVLQYILTKAIEWKYEREWRIIIENGDTGLSYDAKALSSVFLGYNISQENEHEILSILKNTTTKVYKMCLSDSEFKLLTKPL